MSETHEPIRFILEDTDRRSRAVDTRPLPYSTRKALVDVLNAAMASARRPMERAGVENELAKLDPVLLLAYQIEALADQRIWNDVGLDSRCANIRDMARELIAKHTGRDFENPLYPPRVRRAV